MPQERPRARPREQIGDHGNAQPTERDRDREDEQGYTVFGQALRGIRMTVEQVGAGIAERRDRVEERIYVGTRLNRAYPSRYLCLIIKVSPNL